MFRRVVSEAESVDQAISKIQAEAPAGYEILQTEVLAEAKEDTITCSAGTTESAFSKARHKVPKGANLTDQTELRQAGSETLTVDAADEAAARAQVERQIEEGTKIQFVKLESAGSNGFLGFGKKPNRYKAQVFHPALVRIGYRVTAKVSATLMSNQAAGEARSAVQELIDLHHQSDPAGSGGGAREQMRQVGQRLESIGGIDLMLATHTLFSRERPKGKRLLEQAWDGIGAWIG
ncbi:MAG: hypothetical protein EHM61_17550 [Acidobacteria bacterium]|nr:MAG: hypothetical protein EHM61_17550 [Acidobacteriota bacterium]